MRAPESPITPSLRFSTGGLSFLHDHEAATLRQNHKINRSIGKISEW